MEILSIFRRFETCRRKYMQKKLKDLQNSAKEIDHAKTKLMSVNTNDTNSLSLGGKSIKNVTSFVYLRGNKRMQT